MKTHLAKTVASRWQQKQASTSDPYWKEMTERPVTESVMASHIQFLEVCPPVIEGIEELLKFFPRNFTSSQLKTIRDTRDLLKGKQVPVSLMEVEARKPLRRPRRAAGSKANPKQLIEPLLKEVIPKARPALAEALAEALQEEMYEAVDVTLADCLGKPKAAGKETYSNGTHPGKQYLGYAFTLSFPGQVVLTGSCTLTLRGLAKALEKAFTSEGLVPDRKEVLKFVNQTDFGPALRQIFNEEVWAPKTNNELPPKLWDDMTSLMDAKMGQSIEAYSHEEDKVELAEYPAIYVDWMARDARWDYGAITGSRGEYKIPIKATFDMQPARWSYTGRSDWHKAH